MVYYSFSKKRTGHFRENVPKLEFKVTLHLIRSHPKIGVVKAGNIRKFSLIRFRYDVFYNIKDDTIFVSGVLHQRRDPELIKSRLKDNS